MTVLYADYVCPKCSKEEKLMYEIEDNTNRLIFPGDEFSQSKNIKAECEFCNNKSDVKIMAMDNKFVGFINRNEIKEKKYTKAPEKDDIFNKWKNEKTFIEIERYDFKKQPFNIGKLLNIAGNKYSVTKIFRTEWVEKDIDTRIENPRPDQYWYELKGEKGTTKWMKVENIEGENVFVSDTGIIVKDEFEVVEDITSDPKNIKRTFESEWFGGRSIEAYQYINGVRMLVYNHKRQIEMDVFEDTFQEAMDIIEENMELGMINE